MLFLISPAKKMRIDPDSYHVSGLPRFMEQTRQLLSRLRELSYQECRALWNCSDSIARENYLRIQNMEPERSLTCALTAYDGIQYRHLAPDVCTQEELDYLQGHLRILSGFYGVLAPFDGVTPYRLEMQAKLSFGPHRNLYGFWGDRIARSLEQEGAVFINLASQEYALAVVPHLAGDSRVITCRFFEQQGPNLREKGTLCKMARGEMVRYAARIGAKKPEELEGFCELGFAFSPEHSNGQILSFLRQGTGPAPEGRVQGEGPWSWD